MFVSFIGEIRCLSLYRNRNMSNYLTIVTYHGVVPKDYEVEDRLFDGNLIRSDVFQQQIRLLSSQYNVIHPEELNSCLAEHDTLPPNSVLITCDDGLLNNVRIWCGIKRRGTMLPFFVTAESVKPSPPMLWHDELYLMLKSACRDLNGIPIRVMGTRRKLKRREIWWQLVCDFSKVDNKKDKN